jgi:hypothetical protein
MAITDHLVYNHGLFEKILKDYHPEWLLSNEALFELDWYAKLSGLNFNYTKTRVVWIRSKLEAQVSLYRSPDINKSS